MERVIYSQNKRPPKSYQPHGGRVLLERQGYVSAKDRIEAILMAGKRLIETRGFQYDFEPGKEIDEDYYDPTRNKAYDMVDAFQDGIALEERFKEVRKKAKEAESKKRVPDQELQDKRRGLPEDEVDLSDTKGR